LPAGTLLDSAARHGMLGFLAEADARFVDAGRSQAANALAAIADLASVTGRLSEARIDALALKGPVLGAMLYASPALRPFGDLDILVRPRDLPRARAVIESIGYRSPLAAAPGTIHAWQGAMLLRADGRTPIDLHWRLGIRRFGSPVGIDDAFARAAHVSAGGLPVRTLSPTDTALSAVLHAAKHSWSNLEIVLALACLLTHQDVDWNDVWRGLQRIGMRPAGAVSAALAAGLFGAPVPPCCAPALTPREDSAIRLALSALALGPSEFPPGSAERALHRRLFETPFGEARYLALTVIEPTAAEWSSVRLPPPLAPLYVLVRLGRLLASPGRRRSSEAPAPGLTAAARSSDPPA
jgi:hypothetical protein